MGCGLCSMLLKELPWRPCENRYIKLVSADAGKVMRFKRRVYVTEYPTHAVFDAATLTRLGTRGPLDHNSELQAGQTYYLFPLPSAASRIEELKQIISHPQIISTSFMDGERVLRVKLRMRKKDVASFLSSNNIKDVAENFVMKESPSLGMGQQHSYNSASGFSSEWKPSLNAIAEINSNPAGN